MSRVIFIFALIFLQMGSTFGAFQVDPETKFIVDDEGRSRLFHGVNAVVKIPPYIPSTTTFSYDMSMTTEDIANMKKWGFNVVRLGVMWVAVEPTKGQYNTTYLESVRELTDTLGKNGISTIVDMHQDVFARHYCGEGFPAWVAEDIKASHSCSGIIGTVAHWLGICKTFDDYHFELDAEGDPLIKDCLEHMFSLYYPMPEVSSSFQIFYDSTDLQDRFAAYWKKLAETFADSPYVLGYDFLNEPWVGNIWQNITRLIPGKVDREVLQPMYQRLNKVIRAVDQEKIVFFEPVQDDKVGILGGIVAPVGFTESPGGESYNNRQMLNFHVYCCQKGVNVCKTGEPTLEEASSCEKWDRWTVDQRTKDAEKLKIGSFMTEFGACFNTEACQAEIESVTRAADSRLVSWAYWQFKAYGDYTTSGSYKEGLFNTDGTPQELKVRTLARSYAPMIAGVPTFTRYDDQTNAFSLEYNVDSTLKAATSVYLNQVIEQKEYEFLFVDSHGEPVKYTREQNGHLLDFTYTGGSLSTSAQPVRLTVTPPFKSGSTSVAKYLFTYSQTSTTLSYQTRVTIETDENLSTELQIRVVDMYGGELCSMDVRKESTTAECELTPSHLPGYGIEVYERDFFVFWAKKGTFTMGAINGFDYNIKLQE